MCFSYLIWKLSYYFVKSICFFCEIFCLCEEVLRCIKSAFAFRELIHREGHGRHIFCPEILNGCKLFCQLSFNLIVEGCEIVPLYNIIVFVCSCTLPFFSLGVHLRGHHFHLQTRFRNLRLLIGIQTHRFQRFTRCTMFLQSQFQINVYISPSYDIRLYLNLWCLKVVLSLQNSVIYIGDYIWKL